MVLKNKFYAQIDAAGVCVAVSELAGEITADAMIELQAFDPSLMGKRWTGQGWEDVAATQAEAAAIELAQIDKSTGMSRTMREAFIALGVKVGADVAYLQLQETKAAAARLKLK